MIFEKPPSDFSPIMDVVACFIVCGNEYLAVQYNERKGGRWGVVGGKRESDETRDDAIVREVFEESGFKFRKTDFKKHITFPIRYPDFDFWYTIYSVQMLQKKNPVLDSHEHQAFRWVTPTDALQLNLLRDEAECIKYFFYAELPY